MTEARRILYHHRIRADDGQAVHVRELITAMRLAGHDVNECALVPKAVVAAPTTTPTEQSSADQKPGFWQRLSLPRAAVEVLEVVYNHKGRSMLRAEAKRQKPQFLYERHSLHLRAGLDVAREFDIPLLLEVNSPMVAEMQRLGKLCLPRRARRTEQHVLANADAVLAVTQVLADMLVDLGAKRDRVHVIGNGAVAERYGDDTGIAAKVLRERWQLPTDAFVLGFVGYMRPWHRLDLVLDVMQRSGLESMVLVLMGEGPALHPLQELARQRGMQDRVRALGVVPPDLLSSHVMACDGALIPAINAYASPLKLFDSLAAGVVTLAPDQPNLRENIVDGENGLLFAEGDADGLYVQLQRVVGDRALAQRIGAAGKRSLIQNRWTWAGNAERVLEVFDALPSRVNR
ncbi:MAG: glycosyltransferase involved in cell wall biosynthesis [Planctomycetota bacterium]|jgi:glycosyltransferase involved in cell wall biosynthesis